MGGIVSVPLDKDLQYEELENSLIRSKADCIIFDEKLTNSIAQIKENNNTSLTQYVCMGEADGFSTIKELLGESPSLTSSCITEQ